MAFWNKKKNDAPAQSESAKEEKQEASTLDLIKEAMEEAKEERSSQMQQQAAAAQNNGMPTPDEIRKAQEVLARAQAAQQGGGANAGSAKVGANAPINTASLKAVINLFVQSKSQENLKRVMDCLQNPKTLVCVPAQIITSKENQEKMKKGGEVKLEGPVHINPVLLTDNTGKKVFPIFSGEDTIPDDIKSKTPKVNMPLGQCINIMRGMKDVDTFALDPYTANIRIGVNAEEKK